MVIRKKLKRKARPPFNTAHVATLCLGVPHAGAESLQATETTTEVIEHDCDAPPLDRRKCAAAWHELGYQIMRQWIADHPGTRPWGFWTFERHESHPASAAEQLVRLVEFGDLTIEEEAWLRDRSARPDIPAADQRLFRQALAGEWAPDGDDEVCRLDLIYDLLFCAGPSARSQ